MSRAAILAVALAAAAGGCLGGSSAHGVMTASQAQAVKDGLAAPRIQSSPPSWRCETVAPYFQQLAGGVHRTGYVSPRYSLVAGDRRIPPRGGSARAWMVIVLLPGPEIAARCARAVLLSDEHLGPTANGEPTPYKVVDPATIVVNPHPPGAPGTLPGETGRYDTAFAVGSVLALGLSDNRRHAAVIEADLRRLAGEIAR